MARADRRRAVREARHTQHRPMAQRERAMAEQEMFFPKLRKQARWVFALLAVVFAGGFVFLGVGSGSSVGDLLQGNWSDLFGGSGSTADKDADKAREEIAKHPDDAQAYRDLATALEAGKHPDEAIAPLEKYRTLRPKDTDALGELASAVRDLMDALLEQGWKQVPPGGRWFNRRFVWSGDGPPPGL